MLKAKPYECWKCSLAISSLQSLPFKSLKTKNFLQLRDGLSAEGIGPFLHNNFFVSESMSQLKDFLQLKWAFFAEEFSSAQVTIPCWGIFFSSGTAFLLRNLSLLYTSISSTQIQRLGWRLFFSSSGPSLLRIFLQLKWTFSAEDFSSAQGQPLCWGICPFVHKAFLRLEWWAVSWRILEWPVSWGKGLLLFAGTNTKTFGLLKCTEALLLL